MDTVRIFSCTVRETGTYWGFSHKQVIYLFFDHKQVIYLFPAAVLRQKQENG